MSSDTATPLTITHHKEMHFGALQPHPVDILVPPPGLQRTEQAYTSQQNRHSQLPHPAQVLYTAGSVTGSGREGVGLLTDSGCLDAYPYP